ncbi:MAG TPA: ergothioneine biosynthesis protein EgtB [Thermoleophilaceae bacterium]|nr:ergothioneine biosynthesis protein EgtB [Thermoleophilaceae bacterium]
MRPRPTQTAPPGGAEGLPKEHYASLLAEARERTLWLVAPVSVEDLERVHSPLLSPLVWDLGHIAAFEDLWLCQQAGGLDPLREDLSDVYDATLTPRADRGELPYLEHAEALAYMAEVRERALEVLASADLSAGGGRLTAGGFVWDMLVQHEHQHNETMLQTLSLAAPGVFSPRPRPLPSPPPGLRGPDMVRVEGGPCLLGDGSAGFAYDNERPRHGAEVDTFEIDRLPVTNGAYMEFVERGGYARREWWSEEGWAWLQAEGAELPLYWTAGGEARAFDRTLPLDPDLPVMHVCWHEAEAYARSLGKRLPTEAEWEKAASWDEAAGIQRVYPWGDEPPGERHANLDQLGFGPARAGAYPAGASPYGALGMVGDAWEWTASDFSAYPGFEAFPYNEYSEIFFGRDFKVLRGGSWATRRSVARATFRNWDFPVRRQIFAGFRCAA